MIRSYIRGGNGFIRSSIACHLICIILLNRRSFHKKCPLTKADNISGLRIPQNWLLHFHRKFNLAIPSRFPGSRIITSSLLLMRKHNGLWDSLLCYSDRIAQVSHLIPSLCTVSFTVSALNMFCMELYWRYSNTNSAECQLFINVLYDFPIWFFRIQKSILSERFLCHRNIMK